MICQKCGTSFENGVRFCYNCGAPVEPNQDLGQDTFKVETQQIQKEPYTGNQQYSYQNNQPYNNSPYNQPYNSQPYKSQPYKSQPYNGQPYSNQPPYFNGQTSTSGTPRRCKACKTVFHEGNLCPKCNSTNVDYNPDLWMGILALVFGVLGGWLGLLFGIFGIKSANQTGNKKLKIMCIIAIPVCIIAMIIWPAIISEL